MFLFRDSKTCPYRWRFPATAKTTIRPKKNVWQAVMLSLIKSCIWPCIPTTKPSVPQLEVRIDAEYRSQIQFYWLVQEARKDLGTRCWPCWLAGLCHINSIRLIQPVIYRMQASLESLYASVSSSLFHCVLTEDRLLYFLESFKPSYIRGAANYEISSNSASLFVCESLGLRGLSSFHGLLKRESKKI